MFTNGLHSIRKLDTHTLTHVPFASLLFFGCVMKGTSHVLRLLQNEKRGELLSVAGFLIHQVPHGGD